MGLFSSKKNPCPICGGATPRIFARKFEERPLCSNCSGRIDIEPSLQDNMTIQSIMEHFAFLDENQALRDSFIISKKLDFGFLGETVIFDFENKFFCMSGEPDKTVFEGHNLKSFTIKEDHSPIFEGSPSGLKRYTSTVPESVTALAPQIALLNMTQRMADRLDNDDGKKNNYRPRVDISEPFEKFQIELKLEHPYWNTIAFSMGGPEFNNSNPDANNYLHEYYQDAAKLEELARALMAVAFEDAGEVMVGEVNTASPTVQAAPPVADSIEEIKRFKALMEEGVITAEEFAAKKKQLLGI